jgi:GYF domain 2
MSNRAWFYASEGQQHGPYPEAELREFIARGTVTADTLIWTEGMVNWQRAAEIPDLASSASGPPSLPQASATLTTGDIATGGSLSADFGIWALLGRSLLLSIGMILVVPAPWAATGFYRWLVQHLHVPQRPEVGFTGKPGDIWYVFVIQGLCVCAGVSDIDYLPYALLPVEAFLWWMIVRWFVANVAPDGHQLPLTFTGSVWGYVGWYLLALVSFLTIIGWAWVFTAWGRWMCRNVDGTRRQITFNATGWQMLWRMLLFTLAMALIVPIPWALAWYVRWNVSQFALVERTAYANV